MKRIKIVIGILILQIGCFFSAGSQDLLNDLLENENVTWVVETEIYFSLEGYSKEESILKHDLSGYQTKLETIKISPEIYNEETHPNFLVQGLIHESVLGGNQEAFDTEGKELTIEEFKAYFTTVQKSKSIDPVTGEVLIGVRYSEDWSTRGFIVKMLWYYNQKELSISSKVLSFVPVTDKYINDNEKIVITTKGTDSNVLHYNDEQVMWCKATKINQFDFSKSKLHKGNHIQFLEEIFKTNIEKEKYKTYSDKYRSEVFYHEELEMVDYEERLLEEVDTFVSFDAGTYEETIEIAISPEIDFKELNLISFIHYWYWDDKSNALSAELKYIGLMDDFIERFRIKAKNKAD